MKRALIIVAVAAILFSCKTTNEPAGQMVDVTVNLSGIDIQVTPEDAPSRMPAASDKDAAGAKVKRIALSVFDLNDSLITSVTQNQDVDAANFGQPITFRLPVGSYKFVAVAHGASSALVPVATINSVTEFSIGSEKVNSRTYSTVQNVTISGNTTQAVTIDMGTRKNATFGAKFTDDNPSDVKKIHIIVSPTSNAYSDLKVNPSTGFAASQWKYEYDFDLDASNISTTKGGTFNVSLMLTAASQTLDVIVNALSATNDTLYTRTLQNVPLQQGHKTLATGTFFSPEVTGTFTFDITQVNDTISLD